ncbi:hypothetical protein [Planomonospora algeriensis]
MPPRLDRLAAVTTFALIRLLPGSDRDKEIEILAPRHRLTILQRQATRPATGFSWSSVGADRQRGERAFHARLPGDLLRRRGEGEPGEALDQRARRDLGLGAGQGGAEAVVDAVAEAQVPV